MSDCPSLSQLTPKELQERLDTHQTWLESGGKHGEPANLSKTKLPPDFPLSGVDLRQVHLEEADFQRAHLERAILTDAHLAHTNLRGAHLVEAHLEGANLLETDLREADLERADLRGTSSLLTRQLAGANLCRAKLPEAMEFGELANVDEASRTGQTLLFSKLLACIYCWISIATTIDARLLTNSAASPLPILDSVIPIAWFYLAAPLVLFVFYIYFHLHLQEVWEALGRLPAVFPDGRPLDKRVYLWFLNGFVRKYSVRLRAVQDGRPVLLRLQRGLAVLLVWWVVPLTLALFWVRYLTVHDWGVTAIHIVLLVLSILIGVGFRNRTAITLSRERKHYRASKAWRWALGLSVIYPLYLVSCGAINGIPADQYTTDDPHWRAPAVLLPMEEGSAIVDRFRVALWCCDLRGGTAPFQALQPYDARRLVPRLFDYIRFKPFANFEEAAVAGKPANWTGERQEEVTPVEVVNLQRCNLRYAKAFRAFLVNADLRGTDLTGANLREANLHGAKFEMGYGKSGVFDPAILEGANLRWAKLRWSRLFGVKLRKGDLQEADLREADLRAADLREANLEGADLRGADLRGADLQGAMLTGAVLTGAQLQGALLPGSETIAPEDL
jgi:uncharacterized protein YjbI with pentapeptide repeats